ncbi:hypothetical protein BJX61DRAFT_403876 [Aspergillus egyptiacus]|nr:hypothetical protein BJX61DRAFT_403876 [Aspergillus egyptiacus]
MRRLQVLCYSSLCIPVEPLKSTGTLLGGNCCHNTGIDTRSHSSLTCHRNTGRYRAFRASRQLIDTAHQVLRSSQIVAGWQGSIFSPYQDIVHAARPPWCCHLSA